MDIHKTIKLSPKAKDDSWNGVMIKSEPPEYSVDEKHLKEEKSNLTNFAIKVKSDLSKNEGDTIKLPAVDMSERYWCSKCQKQLETAESLRIHTEEHDRTEKSDPDPTGSITKPYTCPTCKKVFKKFATVKAHMLKHKPLNLKCKFCQKVFSTQRNIKEHMEIHEKKKYYACDICNKNFIVKSNLKNHLRRHMNEKNFTCNVCKKKFVWKYELELHKVTHTGKKPFQCDDCKKGFSFRSSMKVHILRNMKNGGHNGRVRKNPVNHICDICCESFPLMSALDTHKLIHSDKKPYECEICKRCFVDKYKLRYHQIRRSEEDPYFECEICKLKFCHKRTFLMHEAIHYKFDSQPIPLIKEEIDLQANESEPSIVSYVKKDGPLNSAFSLNATEDSRNNDSKMKNISNKNYNKTLKKRRERQRSVCDICSKTFSSMSNLRNHKKIHQKPFQCKICAEEFTKGQELLSHMNFFHGGTATMKTFPCDICSKRISTLAALKEHKKTHLDKKPFECEICGKGFIKRVKMVSHMQIHSGIRRYACEICNKAFFQNTTLKAHTMKMHNTKKRFTCDFCPKVYTTKSELYSHKWTHTNKNRNECKICGKNFIRPCYLKRHLCILAGDQPFECDFCLKKFKAYYTMKSHIIDHMKRLGVIKDEPARPKFVTVHFSSNKKKKHRRRFDQGFSKSSTDEPDCFPGLMLDEKDPLKLDEDIQIKQEQAMNETN